MTSVVCGWAEAVMQVIPPIGPQRVKLLQPTNGQTDTMTYGVMCMRLKISKRRNLITLKGILIDSGCSNNVSAGLIMYLYVPVRKLPICH